jgi:Asp-tRNA(Asn)/Glu-tRNA(Gln) amidotransferase A subunit family amidase
VSTRGVVPLSWRLDHVGPLARGVGDLALVLEAIAGFDGESMESRRAPADAGDPAGPAAGELEPALKGLVVGRLVNLEETALDPDVRGALEAGAGLLRDLGAVLRPVTLPGYEPSSARRAGLLVCEAEGAVVHERDLAAHPGAFSPEFRRMLEFGRDAPAARLVKAERLVERAGFALRRALEQVDLIVAPATTQPAFAFEVPAPVTQADMTALANFAGCPAVTVPCDRSAGGLPLGLQLIGRPFAERALLRAAGLVEAACRFAERFPPPPLR